MVLVIKTQNYNFMLHKLPLSEVNTSPSIATFEAVKPESVHPQMSVKDDKPMPTNGHNLDSLREFADISRHDDIDKIGIATKKLSESAAKYSKSGLHAQFMKYVQSTKKPQK